MRILLTGVAAMTLSGCSWLGMGDSYKNDYRAHSQHQGAAYQVPSAKKCCVPNRLSTWNVEADLGTEFNVGGTALTGSEAHSGFAGRDYEDVSFDSAYNTGYRASLGGSYALNPNRKLTANAYYSEAEGQDVSIGSRAGADVRGEFSDYKAFGIEGGLRQYVAPVKVPLFKSVRPYVEGRLGAAYVDDISINNVRSASGPTTIDSLGLYESGWVPTAAGLVGVETPLFDRMTVGVETGLRYSGRLKGNGEDLNTGFRELAGANNGSSRVSIPLTLRGRYRF